MCGIVGSLRSKDSVQNVLEGLSRLEYRGYDSCGIAYLDSNKLEVKKSINRIDDLKEIVNASSDLAFGHTRWATHGGVSTENAHPHVSSDQQSYIVHNGVIENYKELKEKYCQNITLKSETDTEVILEVLNYFINNEENLNEAILKFMDVVEGSYAIIGFNALYAEQLMVLKKKSPLLIGKSSEITTASSDPLAVLDIVDDFYQLNDEEYAFLKMDGSIEIYSRKGAINPDFVKIDMDAENVNLGDFTTYMEKEINDQPNVLRKIVSEYKNIELSKEFKETMSNASKIYIVASGTSYHSGLYTRSIIEQTIKVPVEVVIGSEFGYSTNLIPDGSVFIFLSQSGETADSMLVFNEIKDKYKTVAITNTQGSQLDRNANYSFNVYAGREIAVASTKAYVAQIATVIVLIHKLIDDNKIFDQLLEVAFLQEEVLNNTDRIKEIAEEINGCKEILVLGRLQDYNLAQEAALKIKEITYININAYAAGELKHGPIALVDDESTVFLLDDYVDISSNSRSNMEEVKARGGNVYIFSNTNTKKEGDAYTFTFAGNEELVGLVAIIPQQLMSLYIAQQLGYDIDKPRNLAKSVTVE